MRNSLGICGEADHDAPQNTLWWPGRVQRSASALPCDGLTETGAVALGEWGWAPVVTRTSAMAIPMVGNAAMSV